MKKFFFIIISFFPLISLWLSDLDQQKINYIVDQQFSLRWKNIDAPKTLISMLNSKKQAFPIWDLRIEIIDSLINRLTLWIERRSNISKKKNNQTLVDVYLSWIISTWIVLPAKCNEFRGIWEDFLSWSRIPVELAITTRWMESSCNSTLPANWRWPFQITSKNYGTWKIEFWQWSGYILDWKNLVESKRNRYEKANSNSGFTINISPNKFDFTGLRNHATLYNALSGTIYTYTLTPRNRKYVVANLYSGAIIETWWRSDWFITRFVKLLDRQNKFYFYENR